MTALKVLVVDDASFVRDLVKRTVRNRFPGVELQEAENGRKAQNLLNRVRFDLILCDWEMPEMSGLELLRWLRQEEAYQNTPFVMVTSRGDRDHVVEAIKEGVSDYLGKPFSADGLVKKVVKVMGGRLDDAQPTAHPNQDAFKGSADLLAGGKAQQAAAPQKPAAEPAAPSMGKKSAADGEKATIRFAETSLESVIKGITLTELKVSVPSNATFPAILEPAVVDIELAEGKMARLNGYVHQLQAADLHRDTAYVHLVLRWVDDDPKKMEALTHYISRFRRPKA